MRKKRYQPHDPRVWRTRRGEVLKIVDMDDGYLLNVVHWLRRQASNYSDSVMSGAVSAHEVCYRAIPQYSFMVAELERRGLGRERAISEDVLRRTKAPARRPEPTADPFERFAELIFDQ